MKRVALATADGSAAISRDDVLLSEALADIGIEAQTLLWFDPGVDWASFDAVIVRTTWDYHVRLEEFLEWTRRVAAVTRIWNPPDLMAWNARKAYLEELASKGVPVVPTVVVRSEGDLARLESLGAGPYVVKPEIGACAMDTLVHTNLEFAEAHVRVLLVGGYVLVQPFQASVRGEGEISLVWIGGEVVHAIRKTPKPGDFRVQIDHGGSNERIAIPAEGHAIAEACMNAAPPGAIFGRVDVVRDSAGVLRLMELELIEPELMFEWAPESTPKLAATIRDAIGSG